MNKAELIEAISASANMSKADAGRALDATIEAVSKSLKKVIVFRLLVSELFQLPNALHVPDAIRKPEKQSRSKQNALQNSKQDPILLLL
jgi:hypothetical protein